MRLPSIKKNFIYKLLYEILAIISPLITTPYVSRILGADGIGIYSYTLSIMSYFTLFAALGTSNYGSREIARHRDDVAKASRIFWEIELMSVFTSCICLCGWVMLSLYSNQYKYCFMALTPMLLGTMVDISWYYTGYEKINYTVIWNSICKLLGTVSVFILVKKQNDLLRYIALNAGIYLLGNISMWIYLPRMLTKINIKELSIRRHFKKTFTYFIPSVAISIYTVLDKTLIGVITKDAFENGYYEQANKIINIIKTITFVALNSVMGARLSYLFSQKKYEEFRNRIQYSMDFILLIGYGCIFGIIAVAADFVPLFFGKGYEPVVKILCFMSPLVIIIGISNCLGNQYLLPSGQIKKAGLFVSIGSVINLFANLLLIPQYGSFGAVLGSILAESVITILFISVSKQYITYTFLLKKSLARIIAGLIMCTTIILLKNYFQKRIILEIVWGVFCYFIILIIAKDYMLSDLIQKFLKTKSIYKK